MTTTRHGSATFEYSDRTVTIRRKHCPAAATAGLDYIGRAAVSCRIRCRSFASPSPGPAVPDARPG